MNIALAQSSWTPRGKIALVSILAVICVLPMLFREPYYASLTVSVAITLILTLGLNLLTGTAGLFCLCHGAFFGLGAYLTAIVALQLGWPVWTGAPISIILGAGIAYLIGVPLLRLNGYFLATGSIALQLIIEVLIRHLEITGGAQGITNLAPLDVFGVKFVGTRFVPVAVVAAALVVVLLRNITASPLGQSIRAVRDDARAAAACGLDVTAIRRRAFVLASAPASFAGWLHACYFRNVDPHLFGTELTFTWLFMVMIGGMGNIAGVALGTILLTIVPQFAGVANVQQVLSLGIMILGVVLFMPKGLAGLLEYLKSRAAKRTA